MTKILTLFPQKFSNSMLADVWKCEMYFFRRYCQHLVGSNTNPDALAGSNFARACELVRKAYHNEHLSIDEAINIGYDYLLTAQDTGHSIKTNERLALTLRKYFQTFPLDSNLIPAELSDGTHAIEYTFDFDLGIPHPDIPGTNISFRGKLDGLYDLKHLGKTVKKYILDEKTTGSVSRLPGTKIVDEVKESNKHKMSGQWLAYHWAARQLGVKPDSTLVRKVPLLTNYEPAFELELPVTDFMIQQWCVSTMEKIVELIEKYKYYKENINGVKGAYPHSVFYPIYQTGCNDWGKMCQYSEGCSSSYGEKMLFSTHKQMIFDHYDMTEPTPLADYLKEKHIE